MKRKKILSLYGENKLKVMIESGEITRPDVTANTVGIRLGRGSEKSGVNGWMNPRALTINR